jgi:hypothetical protein
MTVMYHYELDQGSPEWLAARIGVLTASEVKLILTPTLKTANNEKTRAHVYEIAAQRITDYVEPGFIGDAMLRGWDDEAIGRDKYSEKYEPIVECGFITNDKFGFMIGYSPDGLIGDAGLWETKSRNQKFQIQTISNDEVPDEYMFQLQTGLLVSERNWIDFTSYSAGMPMWTKRVFPDATIQMAIIEAATKFEASVAEVTSAYYLTLSLPNTRAIETERGVKFGDIQEGEYE